MGDGSREIPNAETIAALNEYSEMQSNPDKYKRYANFQEIIDEVMGTSSD